MNLYIQMKIDMGDQKSTVEARMFRDFYGNPQGLVDIYQVCEHVRNR